MFQADAQPSGTRWMQVLSDFPAGILSGRNLRAAHSVVRMPTALQWISRTLRNEPAPPNASRTHLDGNPHGSERPYTLHRTSLGIPTLGTIHLWNRNRTVILDGPTYCTASPWMSASARLIRRMQFLVRSPIALPLRSRGCTSQCRPSRPMAFSSSPVPMGRMEVGTVGLHILAWRLLDGWYS